VLRILFAQEEAICHWLDTEGSFPPDRAKSVLQSMGIPVRSMFTLAMRLIEGRNIGVIKIDCHALFPP